MKPDRNSVSSVSEKQKKALQQFWIYAGAIACIRMAIVLPSITVFAAPPNLGANDYGKAIQLIS